MSVWDLVDLSVLSWEQRAAVMLVYLLGFTERQAADEMNELYGGGFDRDRVHTILSGAIRRLSRRAGELVGL